jgi:hypothetical protein
MILGAEPKRGAKPNSYRQFTAGQSHRRTSGGEAEAMLVMTFEAAEVSCELRDRHVDSDKVTIHELTRNDDKIAWQ